MVSASYFFSYLFHSDFSINYFLFREIILLEELPTTSGSNATERRRPAPTHPPNDYNYRHVEREVRRNTQVTILLFAMTFSSTLLWLPWTVFNGLLDWEVNMKLRSDQILKWMAVCNLIASLSATTNAILYGYLHVTIKKEMVKYLHLPCTNSNRNAQDERNDLHGN